MGELRSVVRLFVKERAPYFIETLKDLSARVGDAVKLECLVSKTDAPVIWMR